MKYLARRPVCVLLLTIAFACCANAQNQAVPEDVRAFAARYVAAGCRTLCVVCKGCAVSRRFQPRAGSFLP
jgi:hypothetical protein